MRGSFLRVVAGRQALYYTVLYQETVCGQVQNLRRARSSTAAVLYTAQSFFSFCRLLFQVFSPGKITTNIFCREDIEYTFEWSVCFWVVSFSCVSREFFPFFITYTSSLRSLLHLLSRRLYDACAFSGCDKEATRVTSTVTGGFDIWTQRPYS